MEWQPIETAPRGKLLIMFAEYHDKSNWKMAVGSFPFDYSDNTIYWDGRYIETYELKPTHWMNLPEPPQ